MANRLRKLAKEAFRQIQRASPKVIAASPEKFAALDAVVKAAMNPKGTTAKEIKTILKSNLLTQKID